MYSSAMLSTDNTLKSSLYYQSEAKNKTAKTWILISIIFGIIDAIAGVILFATGVLSELFPDLFL